MFKVIITAVAPHLCHHEASHYMFCQCSELHSTRDVYSVCVRARMCMCMCMHVCDVCVLVCVCVLQARACGYTYVWIFPRLHLHKQQDTL